MTTISLSRRLGITVLLAGAATLAAAPAYAAPAPVAPPAPHPAVTAAAPSHPSKALTEHREAIARADRAGRDPQPAGLAPAGQDPSGPSSAPLTPLVLLGGGLALGAAGYAAGRSRRPGRTRPATV
jgi:hypothetical protein